jgi:uncharacterized protein YhbP (UPF0306 family)
MAFFIQSHRWIDGIVPYRVGGSGVTDSAREMIKWVIKYWYRNTGIRFRLRKSESDYVKIVVEHGLGGGRSDIGRRGGMQKVRIDPDYNPPWALSHEFAHTVGMIHEHNRPDRNKFVKLTSKADDSYAVDPNGIMAGPYDCRSNMAYLGDPGFTYIPGACDPGGHGLSTGDRKGIKYIYAGALGSRVATYDWKSGWTTAFFYEVAGKPFMFFLKAKDGTVHIHRVNADGKVGDKIDEYDWTNGWTTAFFYEVAGKPFMFFLKASNGIVHIHRVNPDGKVGDKIDEYDWKSGWTTAFFYEVAGNPFMFFLKAKDGTVHIHRVNSDGKVGDKVDGYDWTKGWTTAFFYEIQGNPYIFLLKDLEGFPPPIFPPGEPRINAARIQVLPDGTIGSDLERYDWDISWTTAFFYEVAGKRFMFFLRAPDGIVHIRRVGVSA